MTCLQILGLIAFIIGMASVAVRLLYWMMDLDLTFHLFDD